MKTLKKKLHDLADTKLISNLIVFVPRKKQEL